MIKNGGSQFDSPKMEAHGLNLRKRRYTAPPEDGLPQAPFGSFFFYVLFCTKYSNKSSPPGHFFSKISRKIGYGGWKFPENQAK